MCLFSYFLLLTLKTQCHFEKFVCLFLTNNVVVRIWNRKHFSLTLKEKPHIFFLPAFQSTPSQNIVKRPNQQLQPTAPRNSNLRELPIAPSHALEVSNSRRTSAPAAQVKPITSTMSASKTVAGGGNPQGRPEMKAKAVTPVGQAKPEVKSEPEVRLFFFFFFQT